MKSLFSILFVLLTYTTKVFAQTGGEGLYKEYKKVDKELNVVYNKLKNKLGSVDKAALIQCQKAWLQFRDSNCKLLLSDKRRKKILFML